MIYSTEGYYKWRTWFAIFPTIISQNADGSYNKIWLELYHWRHSKLKPQWGHLIERRPYNSNGDATYYHHAGDPT